MNTENEANANVEPENTLENTEVVESKSAVEVDKSSNPDEALEPSEFIPNYTYKYAVEGSKQAEGEIDDIFKPLVKDSDTEKKIRELYEKAYGLDFIKKDREAVKQWATKVNDDFTNQSKALETVGTYLKNKDYDSFFEAWGLSQQDIMQYALQKAQYQQMTPEQQEIYNQQIADRQRYTALELQNRELQQNMQNFSTMQRENELNAAMSRPEVASLIQAFDQRRGQPGAFRNEVIQRGKLYWHETQKDMPAQFIVDELVNLFGMQSQQPVVQQPHVTAQAPKPVIPNITGKGTSPVKRVPKSLDDLRKMAAQMSAAQ